jgi:CRP-like cAMP-binding protein
MPGCLNFLLYNNVHIDFSQLILKYIVLKYCLKNIYKKREKIRLMLGRLNIEMSDNSVLSGSISFVSLADLFQIVGGNNCSGILTLRSHYAPQVGMIYFDKGNPINASYGNLKGIKAIYMLFGWIDGEYDFCEEDMSQMDHLIRQSRMEIVLDALRMLDDGEISKVGPPSFLQEEPEEEDQEEINVGLPVSKGPLIDYLYVIREEHYRDRSKIVREGKHGKWMWTIYEGNVKVTRNTPNGNILLARLGEGCFIGTIRALLFGEYERNATVTAEGDVRLCLLDAEPLFHEFASLSMDFRSILLSLDHRLRLINEMAVKQSANNKFKVLSKDNKIYINRFQSPSDLYLIKEGKADIIGQKSSGDLTLLSLEKNDIFGNVPFMDFGHEPRSASVMVSRDFDAVKLDTQGLLEEYNSLSCTFRNLIFNMCTNLFMTTKLVYGFNDGHSQLAGLQGFSDVLDRSRGAGLVS